MTETTQKVIEFVCANSDGVTVTQVAFKFMGKADSNTEQWARYQLNRIQRMSAENLIPVTIGNVGGIYKEILTINDWKALLGRRIKDTNTRVTNTKHLHEICIGSFKKKTDLNKLTGISTSMVF